MLSGLAPDGGLYLPDSWPQISPDEIAGFAGRPYVDVAHAILNRFVDDPDLRADLDAAYASFDGAGIAPLTEYAPDRYLLELFHGPTLAFKDIAMQVLGRLFARALAKRGGRATVVAATSGDTGSAAIAALGGLADIELFVLHPLDRVSEVQRRQMTTATQDNVHNIALQGSFDDAQAIVKALFADAAFARQIGLTAVNSINFARIIAQSVYYFTAAVQLQRPAIFVVPTGNFGDAFAGEAAMRMGLPIEKIVIATNSNDIMARVLSNGVYATGTVQATLSPSMDIQVASNFERALFEASGRDAGWIVEAMAAFARDGQLVLPPPIRTALAERYQAHRADDAETLATMASFHTRTGQLIDPHTAVAMAAAERLAAPAETPVVVLSTAHPAKFPDAVAQATGRIPPLPPRLSDLYQRPEKMTVLAADMGLVRDHIAARMGAT